MSDPRLDPEAIKAKIAEAVFDVDDPAYIALDIVKAIAEAPEPKYFPMNRAGIPGWYGVLVGETYINTEEMWLHAWKAARALVGTPASELDERESKK